MYYCQIVDLHYKTTFYGECGFDGDKFFYDVQRPDDYFIVTWLDVNAIHKTYSKGIELISQERKEQIEKHGFDVHRDKQFYENSELVDAAIFALNGTDGYYPKTWDRWFADNMTAKSNRMNSVEFRIESN